EVGPDETDDLLLSVLLDRIDAFVWPLVPGQGVVHRQCEEWVLAGEGVLEHVQERTISLTDRVLRYLRRLARGTRRSFACLPDLARARIGPAALNDQVAKDGIRSQHLLSVCQMTGLVDGIHANAVAKRFFHVIEVRAEVVDA